jgi:hypothetical protein
VSVSEKLGLRSEELRAALADALARRPSRLGELLARHGGLPGPKANLALAAAFGEEIARADQSARPLLDALRRDPAEADTAGAFLPVAASFGYAARLSTDPRDAWNGIFELTADDRAPVRIGLAAALAAFAARASGNLDALVAQAESWLEHDDRDHVFASQAIALDVVAERRGLEGLEDHGALLAWLERVIDALANAPRAAQRSPARRKTLVALPAAVAEAVVSLRGAQDGPAWLTERLQEAHHRDLREAFDRTIDELRRGSRAQSPSIIGPLREALASSAKPPRDPTLIREGVRGRGKKHKRRSR